VLSGKASSKGMQKAITKTCESIKMAITTKVTEVDANTKTLDALPAHHQALFQDRVQLIALSPDQLNTLSCQRLRK